MQVRGFEALAFRFRIGDLGFGGDIETSGLF